MWLCVGRGAERGIVKVRKRQVLEDIQREYVARSETDEELPFGLDEDPKQERPVHELEISPKEWAEALDVPVGVPAE